MSASLTDPVLTLYRRAQCHLCDDARELLQAELEDRVRRGDPVPAVREVEVSTDPALEARYGALVPVFALDGQELPLVMSGRHVRAFLDRALPRLA